MRQQGRNLWHHSDFRKLWAGQTISLIGSQITGLALPLTAVLSLHATAIQMGFLQAAGSLPILMIGLVAGVWIDRLRRLPILIGADWGRAVLLGSIPLAAFFHILVVGIEGVVASSVEQFCVAYPGVVFVFLQLLLYDDTHIVCALHHSNFGATTYASRIDLSDWQYRLPTRCYAGWADCEAFRDRPNHCLGSRCE